MSWNEQLEHNRTHVVKVALPEVASVPAWAVVRYCEVPTYPLSIRYYVIQTSKKWVKACGTRKSYGKKFIYVTAEGGGGTANEKERQNIISTVRARVEVPATRMFEFVTRPIPTSDSPSVTSDSDVGRDRDG